MTFCQSLKETFKGNYRKKEIEVLKETEIIEYNNKLVKLRRKLLKVER